MQNTGKKTGNVILRCKLILCVFCFSFFSSFLSFAAEEEKTDTAVDYRSRKLGDAALNNGSVEQAINFYSRFKEEAKNDKEALKDAYDSLISACIKAGNHERASKELEEFSAKFSGLDKNEKELFKADILAIQSKSEEAAKIYADIAGSFSVKSPDKIYCRALTGLGFSYMKLKKWNEAEKAFTDLQLCGKGTKWEIIALREKIYSMIMAGKFTEAKKQLDSLEKATENDHSDPKILKILILAREEKLSEIRPVYDNIKSSMEEGPNPLMYMTDVFVAKAFISQNDPLKAVPYIKDAFVFASSAEERQQALRMIINAYILLDNREEAVAAAKLYMEYYEDADDIQSIRLQSGKLLWDLRREKEALKIYSLITDDNSADMLFRIDAAKQSASIFIDQKKYKEAENKLNFIFENAPDDYVRGEGKFLLARLLYTEGKYREAASAFIVVSEKYRAWREKSFYWAMRSLIECADYGRALSVSEHILKEFPSGETKKECIYFHALILEKQNNIDKALKEFAVFTKNYPSNEFAPLALFESGKILYDKKDYVQAISHFSEFLKNYPNNPLAANVLYKRLYSNYFQGNIDAAVEDVKILSERYPKSQFTVAALFWLSDYYSAHRIYDKADAVLGDIIIKYKDDEDTVSQALYDRAYICLKSNSTDRALNYLKELFEKYPDNKIVSEGLFLCGDVYSEKNDYLNAITYFMKASERRPGSELETAVWGRVGDCNFSLYSKAFDKKYLEEAVSSYGHVIKNKKISGDLRNQALFKTGRSYELMGDSDKALEKYNELIYGYKIDLDEGRNVKPVWLVKAAKAAVSIHLKQNTPENAKAAIDIYRNLIELNIGPVEDYKKTLDDIRKKYKI